MIFILVGLALKFMDLDFRWNHFLNEMAEIPKGDLRDKNDTICCYVMFILEKQFETISSSTLVEAYRYLNYKKRNEFIFMKQLLL